MNKTKLASVLVTAGVLTAGLSACGSKADTASHNLSVAADNFGIERRITFINGITDKYLLTITGLCSLGNHDSAGQLTVTCKTGPNTYRKHFLGLSDNVTYVVEQISDAVVSVDHYKVIFRPETIVPDISVN